MSEGNPIRIFVTHAFEEDEDYGRVFEYLESRDNFFYQNYADPSNRPEPAGRQALKDASLEQIKPAEIMVLPVGMYQKHADLLDYQMDVAQAHKMPILGIKEFGADVDPPPMVAKTVTEIVDWNDRIITDAIRRLARNEATAEWEVVEFTLD